MTTKNRLGRLAAGASALALVGAGLLGSAASAQPEPPAQINPAAEGSLIVHKFDGTPGDKGDGTPINTSTFGNALGGVEFTVQGIDLGTTGLDTAEGWQKVADYQNGLPTVPNLSGSSVSGTTNPSGEATFSNLPVGAYYVTETGSGANLITTPVVPFIVTIPYPNDGNWLYDVHVYPKNVVTDAQPTKTAVAPEGVAQTGDKVDWTISVAVPQVTNGYSSFVITDSPGAGLEFDSWGTITVGGTALEPADYAVDPANVVTLTASGLTKLNNALAAAGGEPVLVAAELTTTRTATGELTNEANITINGVPLEEPSADTNWGKIVVTKISGEDAEATLQGAEFELYDAKNGNLIGAAMPTGPNGELTFTVWVGNDEITTRDGLFLKETVAPAGHVLPSDPWFAVGTVTADANTSVEISISNYKPEGPDLPLTGAQGTLLFTLVGLGLIGVGAAAVGIRRARANH